VTADIKTEVELACAPSYKLKMLKRFVLTYINYF